ncbi:MAG: nitrilase-related carbon-nitrogen hydrolase [Desulfatiglandales bacterium]
MKDLRIAAVCMQSKPGDIDGNLEKTEAFVREASNKGADVVCFPELSISGYGIGNAEILCPFSRGEEIIRRATDIARQYRIVLVVGMIEWAEEQRPYISQIAAGPKGLIAVYRKTHLSPPERECYQPGRVIDIVSCDDLLFGIQLCYEAHFPEISTIMALKGAEVVLIPHASPRGEPETKRNSWFRHLQARAYDNAMFVVACNQVGRTDGGYDFPGVAVIMSPAGRVMAEYTGHEEKVLIADLSGGDIEDIKRHRMRYFLPQRRPELYGALCAGKD